MNPAGDNTHKTESLTPEAVQRYRLVVITACSVAMSISVWAWLLASRELGVEFSWSGILVCQVFSLLGFAYYSYTKSFNALRYSQVLFMLFVPLVAQLSMESGHVSAIILWSFLAPVSVSMIAAREDRDSMYWLAAKQSQYATDIIVNHMLPINIAMFTGLLTFALYYSLRHRSEINQLRKQQYFNLQDQQLRLNSDLARKDALLSSVLPARIATRMLDGSKMIADGHSDVTVMFADIVGFTKLADTMSPKQIVRLLNQLFSGFDDIADKYGLEKIKTIGDAYLAVGGLVNSEQGDYVESTVKAAEEFHRYLREQTRGQFHGNALDIHIGIATGPIAAGVIGRIRLTYDIWGDTVNRASRLVDQASAGQILVDHMTHKRVAEKFAFAAEEVLTLKRGMQIKTFRLNTNGESFRPLETGNIYKMHS
jgi:adenylate cyclase